MLFHCYPTEQLPSVTHLQQRKDWVTLNRGRAKVGKTMKNLHRRGLQPTSECPCGHQSQTMEHILENCILGPKTTNTDLLECNDTALEWIQKWRDKIWWWWLLFNIKVIIALHEYVIKYKNKKTIQTYFIIFCSVFFFLSYNIYRNLLGDSTDTISCNYCGGCVTCLPP